MFTPTPLRRTLAAALRDLASSKPAVRVSAAQDLAIAGQDDPLAASTALEPLLRDPEDSVRGEAALALGALGARAQVDALAALLDDANATVRQHAVIALGEIGGERAMEVLARTAQSGPAEARYQALLAIAQLDPRRGFEVALSAVADDDVWIASEAAEQLGALLTLVHEPAGWSTEADRARAREALRARLAGPSGRVALCAAMALARLGDDRGREPIVRYVRGELATEPSDDASELRHKALEALGTVGGPDARAVLEPLAWRLLPSLEREIARAALARLGDARACASIVEQLGARSAGRRADAVLLARDGRVKDAVPVLLELLRARRADPLAVVDALAAIDDPRAADALETVARGGSDEAEVRAAARAALDRAQAHRSE